jgi:hypothetical protein
MLKYRGFQLIETVTVHPPCRAGQTGVSVRDDVIGIIGEARDMVQARFWIDQSMALATEMLDECLNRRRR